MKASRGAKSGRLQGLLQPRFRQGRRLAGLILASLIFMTPLILLPYARAGHTESWRVLGLRGETVLNLVVTGREAERIIYAETHTGLWRYVRDASQPIGVWERIDSDLPRGGLGGPALAAWRNVQGRPLQLYALTGSDTNRQLYKSDDGGTSWANIGPAPGQTARPAMLILPGLNGAPDQILLPTSSRIQRSTDGGATWAPGGPWPSDTGSVPDSAAGEPVHTLLADSSAPEHLYALTADGVVWLSENGGLSWHSAGLDQVSAIALTPYFGMYAWAATADGLALNTEEGTSWTKQSLPDSGLAGRADNLSGHIVALRGDPRVPETLYAALRGGAIYRTDDGGATWSHLGTPGSTTVSGLALDQDSRGLLYAATDDGVWERAVSPLQPKIIPTLLPTPTPLPPTATSTSTPTMTCTATATFSPTPTSTSTSTATATTTATPTRRPTRRPAPTRTPTASPTLTPQDANTLTATPAAPSGGGGGVPPAPPPTNAPIPTPPDR